MTTALYASAVVVVVVIALLTLAGKVLFFMTSILLLLIKYKNKLEIMEGPSAMGFSTNTLMLMLI